MPDRTRIERGLYWDRSWRVVNGCEKVSDGCRNCWSESETNVRGSNPAVAYRYAKEEVLTGGKWNGRISLATERVLTEPLRTKKPQTWAVWNDLFHEDVSVDIIIRAFEVMWQCPQHIFMLLTKRPKRMRAILSGAVANAAGPDTPPAPNVWLGVTAENQEMADQRIPILLQTQAEKRFVSVEPMLGPVDMTNLTHHYEVHDKPTGMDLAFDVQIDALRGRFDDGWDSGAAGAKLDWVICGGESGPGARPMHPDWPRSLRDQCQAAGVPFFFKQWGEWSPDGARYRADHPNDYQLPDMWPRRDGRSKLRVTMWRVGKKAAGCLLDGQKHQESPL